MPATPVPSPAVTPSGTPTPTPATAAPETPAPTADPQALGRKVARLLMVGFRGLTIEPDDPIAVAVGAGLGGVILFDFDHVTGRRNVESPAQLARLTGSLRELAPGNLIIAIDQEGGRVARLRPAAGFGETRSQAAIGATGDPALAFEWGRATGATLADAGIDLNLAPVVDVDVNPANPAIGALGRSYSSDPAVVATMAEATIHGLHEYGVRSAIKHFPGLGSAAGNTDKVEVDVTSTWSEAELAPYEALLGAGVADAVMTGHMVNDTLDPGLPASLSVATVSGLLRGQLGWRGAVITDDLGAEAIVRRYPREEAVALALEAGNDLLLFANQSIYEPDLAAELVGLLAGLVSSGRISEGRIDESIDRLDRLAFGSAIE